MTGRRPEGLPHLQACDPITLKNAKSHGREISPWCSGRASEQLGMCKKQANKAHFDDCQMHLDTYDWLTSDAFDCSIVCRHIWSHPFECCSVRSHLKKSETAVIHIKSIYVQQSIPKHGKNSHVFVMFLL